jgi:hypothetical protein
MPRSARYLSPAFEELERQLIFAPPEALRRQMEAAEALAIELDPEATYPLEFVQWRVTGFRAAGATLNSFHGARLRSDLATFVLHVSERIGLAWSERPGGALQLADAAAHLRVAEKTIRRWRTRGLIAHRIVFPDGRSRIGVFRCELARFVEANPDVVRDAVGFTRLDAAAAKEAVARMRSLIASGITPNTAARTVADEFGRSHETMRQLVLRSLDDLPEETRRRRRNDVQFERRLAWRAWRFGVPIDRIAERSGTKTDAIRRRIDSVRAEKLRAVRCSWIDFPTFDRPDAEETILASPAATTDLAPQLGSACGAVDAIVLLEQCASERSGARAQSIDAAEASETAMLAAANFLKRRARRAIDALGRDPDRTALDRVETDLRWALRIEQRLVERWLPTALMRVEVALGGPLVKRPADEIRSMLERCVDIAKHVVAVADPAKRQSPRRLVALETDRQIARLGLESRSPRASVRHERGSVLVPRLFARITAWQELVDHLGLRERRPVPHDERLLGRRHGWDGGPPHTLEELAAEERTTIARMTKRLAEAERAARGRS